MFAVPRCYVGWGHAAAQPRSQPLGCPTWSLTGQARPTISRNRTVSPPLSTLHNRRPVTWPSTSATRHTAARRGPRPFYKRARSSYAQGRVLGCKPTKRCQGAPRGTTLAASSLPCDGTQRRGKVDNEQLARRAVCEFKTNFVLLSVTVHACGATRGGGRHRAGTTTARRQLR